MRVTFYHIFTLAIIINHKCFALRAYEEVQLEKEYQSALCRNVQKNYTLKILHLNETFCNTETCFTLDVYTSKYDRIETFIVNTAEDCDIHYQLETPFLIKIKQERPYLKFNLSYIRDVDWNPYEEVYSKCQPNYTGCYLDHMCSTCGVVIQDSVPIPNSEGFCCSCAESKNIPCNFGDKREIMYQIRGGQNCDDFYTPPGRDSEHYHLSTHCLRLTGQNLSVYQISQPEIVTNFNLRVFQRTGNGSWQRAHYRPIVVSLINPTYKDPDSTLEVVLQVQTQLTKEHSLIGQYILMPSACTTTTRILNVFSGPREFLVVPPELVGDECDKIGIGFNGFARQAGRCDHIAGTCLRNQPKSLFENELKRIGSNCPGRYFLQFYADVGQNFDDVFEFNKKLYAWTLRVPIAQNFTSLLIVRGLAHVNKTV